MKNDNELIQRVIKEVREMREEQRIFKETLMGHSRRFLLILQRLETESDILKDRIDKFIGFLGIFEKLIHKIRTAFMEDRIWEELQEYQRNESNKNLNGHFVKCQSRGKPVMKRVLVWLVAWHLLRWQQVERIFTSLPELKER